MRRVVVLVGLLGLLLLAWWAWRASLPRGEAVERAKGAEPSTVRDEPADDARLLGRGVLHPPPTDVPETADEPARGEPPGAVIFGRVQRGRSPVEASVGVVPRLDWRSAGAEGRTMDRVLRDWLEPPGPAAAEHTVRTDAEGRFEIADLDPGRYDVVAEDDAGGSARATSVVVMHPGQRVRADVALPAGGVSLAGRAVHEDGRPFEGVVLVFLLDETSLHRRTTAADEGCFAFTGLEPGHVALFALTPRRRSVRRGQTVRVPRAAPLLFVVDEGLEVLEGRVVAAEDGAPLSGASVFSMTSGRERSCTELVSTDAEGRFRAMVSSRRSGSVRASIPGYVPSEVYAPLAAPLELRLERGSRVVGRVTDADRGTHVAGITVCLTSNRQGGGARIVTNDSGLFTIEEQPAGEALLFAIGQGCIPAEHEGGLERAADDLRVDLPPGGTLRRDLEVVVGPVGRGRVLDAEGAPVVGALVSAELCDRQPVSIGAAIRALRGRMDRGLLFSARDHLTVHAVSDARGAFALKGTVPGVAYELKATAADLPPTDPVRVVPVANPVGEIVLRFPRPVYLDVRVVDDETGEPIPGAWVDPQTDPPTWSRDWELTDEEGLARLGPIAPGHCRLMTYAEDHVPGRTGPLEPGPGRVNIRLRRGLTLEGRVLDAEGRPVSEADVFVNFQVDAATEDQYWAMTDDEGRFGFTGLPEGDCSLSVAGDASDERVVQAGAENVVIRLAEPKGN